MEPAVQEIDLREAAVLGATDGVLFSHVFFPKTYRVASPPMHYEMWDSFLTPGRRFVSFQVFRGGAKTTICRTNIAHRVAYAISRTILNIGKSEDAASKTIQWLKRQVEHNTRYASTFGLRPGNKWTETDIEIVHEVEGITIRCIGMGITGSVRGLNIDDHRPDFIILDDVLDEENCATPEQRRKVTEKIFGAVEKSLARPADNPRAQMVMLQTPIDVDDASELTMQDPEWHPVRFGCFDEEGESRWPALFPTEELRKQKESAIARNMLSIWMREMECKVVADEKRYFRPWWLSEWTTRPEVGFLAVLAIDPSPPKDEEPEKRKTKDPDPEVLSVVGIAGGKLMVLETVVIQDPNPAVTLTTLRSLMLKWRVKAIGVETTAYQATLKWIIDEKIRRGDLPAVPVYKIDDKRKKTKRIRHTFTSAIEEFGTIYIHRTMETFRQQFEDYPDVKHDDVLDSVAIGIQTLQRYRNLTYDEDGNVLEEGFADLFDAKMDTSICAAP